MFVAVSSAALPKRGVTGGINFRNERDTIQKRKENKIRKNIHGVTLKTFSARFACFKKVHKAAGQLFSNRLSKFV